VSAYSLTRGVSMAEGVKRWHDVRAAAAAAEAYTRSDFSST